MKMKIRKLMETVVFVVLTMAALPFLKSGHAFEIKAFREKTNLSVTFRYSKADSRAGRLEPKERA